MNIIKTILTALACALSLNACASKTTTDSAAGQPQKENDMKSVIIYFTHSGNTELAAKEIASVTGAKMIRLMPQQPYSSEDVDWVNEQSRCTQEQLNQSLRPAIYAEVGFRNPSHFSTAFKKEFGIAPTAVMG